ALIAKRAGLKLAHLEAGLRSTSLVRPFPEEIVRRIVMRLSDYLFAPSAEAFDNLKGLGVSGRVVRCEANTNAEALQYELGSGEQASAEHKYSVVTLHRVENVTSRRLLEEFIRVVETIAARMPVEFIVHPPTAV